MSYYKTKLLNKIINHDASILFIGENDFSRDLSFGFVKNGFQTIFYSDKMLRDVNELINKGIYITDLTYDFYDIDVVVLSKPSFIIDAAKISDFLDKMISLIKIIFHKGILIIADHSFNQYSVEKIPQRLEMAAFLDPSEPVIENYKEGINYFYCHLDTSKSFNPNEILSSNNDDSLQIGVELIKGSKLK